MSIDRVDPLAPMTAARPGPGPGVVTAGPVSAEASRRVASPPGEWRHDPDHVDPVVLILEGFTGSPPTYEGLADELERRGAAGVEIAQIWLPDWLIASARGFGPIMTRAGRGLLRAAASSQLSPRTCGAPILIVGHSAGGLVARLLTSPEPFAGRRLGAAGRIGAIVSLGSPHNAVEEQRFGRQVGTLASHFAAEHVPGAYFVPRVGYLSVASRAIAAGPEARGAIGRWAWSSYRGLLPPDTSEPVAGDGLIPVDCALLEGSRQVILDGYYHAEVPRGRPWYGSPEAIDEWWPIALEAWHAALRARVELDALT